MRFTYIICRYSENRVGEITLVRQGNESFDSEEKAKEAVSSLFRDDPDGHFVILTEVALSKDSRAS